MEYSKIKIPPYEGDDVDEEFVFKFRGKRYECIGKTRKFDIFQFNTLIEWEDWQTISNRIINQLMWGPNIREVI